MLPIKPFLEMRCAAAPDYFGPVVLFSAEGEACCRQVRCKFDQVVIFFFSSNFLFLA